MKILHGVITSADVFWIFWCTGTQKCNTESQHSLSCWSFHNNLVPRALT